MEFMDSRPARSDEGSAIICRSSPSPLSLAAFHRADDEVTGKARVSDAYGFTSVFVVAGYYISWLPAIWGGPGGRHSSRS